MGSKCAVSFAAAEQLEEITRRVTETLEA